MKRQTKQKKKLLLSLLIGLCLVLVIAAITTAAMRRDHNQTASKASPTPSVTKGNSTDDEPSATPTPATSPVASGMPTPTPTPVAVSKPTLQMSSGNNGVAVPSGRTIEFTCEGTAGLSCEVVLTSRTNPSNVISAGKKTITSNGRGQNFALIDWSAVKGQWTVAAKASNSVGASALSDTQTLEVQ